MRYIFLGSFYTDNFINNIKQFSLGPVGNANDLLQKNIISGLTETENVSDFFLITMPNVGSYPKRYKKWYVNKSSEYLSVEHRKIYCNSLSFINLPGIKHLFRFLSLLTFCISSGYFKRDKIVLFVYDLEIEFLLATSILKKINPHLHVCVIVPDLPGYTSEKKGSLYKIYNMISKMAFNYLNKKIDSYSFISKYMVDKIDIQDKPYVVIEGIYNKNESRRLPTDSLLKEPLDKIVFYSGSLDARNCINNLIEAFKLIKRANYKLYIIGDGPLKDSILKSQIEDTRIEYFGQVSHAEVICFQAQADILVNPRLPLEDFTKYSFPSKTMEYLASGIPTLMYKLPGIPEEYFDFCVTLHGYSSEELAKAIENTIEIDFKIAKERAKAAVEFIHYNKNPISQCRKLIDMIESNK